MRNLLRTASSIALAAGAITLFTTTGAHAQATNLAVWNFNYASGANPATIGPAERAELFSVDGGVNAASASLSTNFVFTDGAQGGTIGITSFAGTSVNALPGTLPGQELALQAGNSGTGTPNNGQYLQFGASTAGFNNINVSFAFRNSGTGFSSNQFQYSVDGATFTTFGGNFTAAASTAQTFDLSSVVGLSNNPNAQFRILLNGATTSAGNARIDNLQINSGFAVAVPEPGTLALLALGGLPVVGLVARRRKSK